MENDQETTRISFLGNRREIVDTSTKAVYDSDWNRIRIVLQKLAKDVEDDSSSVLNDPFFTSDGVELL